ncbi:VOC family protein [Novosphingobium sp. KACC 22771]|uniref:VOC family protein n=1 Tax=Novosphingobium sp. KACC 22771 TaxID=3025670 RepID=UPI0023670770|nr:VOC family protein [Novosphingobium sp. KACC 22771]WDF74461.1 VOC family protein [Novosphingobium sp. KACC 22771]
MTTRYVDPCVLRDRFCAALSSMYRAEVPLYGDLLAIVAQVNARVADAPPARVEIERHGAIRVGTAAELAMMGRAFAVMGMEPVGYYDLAPAGVPVHSTAFRPVAPEALARNPFRVFCSLLRLELIADPALREEAAALLAARQIFRTETLALIARHDEQGGLDEAQADAFVAGLLETFRWHEDTLVDRATYDRLLASHRLVADVVAFRGPHINHLTPRTLDIDAAQAAMLAQGIDAKEVIEGPPWRAVPILLRQTSFKALSESVRFAGEEGAPGRHTARFGEIEQRGAALTPKGRALYDRLLARAQAGPAGMPYEQRLAQAFADFPDDMEALVAQELIYVRRVTAPDGSLALEPLTYEDFLPVSAAGIFQSNLGAQHHDAYGQQGAQAAFEAALGRAVLDPFALYAAMADLP